MLDISNKKMDNIYMIKHPPENIPAKNIQIGPCFLADAHKANISESPSVRCGAFAFFKPIGRNASGLFLCEI